MALERFKTKFGSIQVSDDNTVSGYDVLPVGTMIYWAGPDSSIPSGWLLCDGTEVSRLEYSNLHAVMALSGYPYGSGNGSTTFTLPDAKGRALCHGASPITSGSESYTLSDNDITSHNHTIDHSHTLSPHTHGGVTHNHPGTSHAHGSNPHSHPISVGGDHPHQFYIQSNASPGTTYLRNSTSIPGTTYKTHATGGGNHDHNFGVSLGTSGTTSETINATDYISTSSTTSSVNEVMAPGSPSTTELNGGSSRSSFSLMQPFTVLNVIIKA